jgi:hypothetical protein
MATLKKLGEMKTMNETTSVSLTRRTLDDLKRQGSKGETYDDILRRLLENRPAGRGIAARDEPVTAMDYHTVMMSVRHHAIQEAVLGKLKAGSLKEQWTAPIGLTPAPAARLRNFVIVSDEVVGGPGETVTVPYVKDFDLDILATPGDELTPKTGLTGVVQTTLKEAGATTDISYADLEKMTPEILTELEARFVQASFRAEDKHMLDLLVADSGVPELDKSTDDPPAFPVSYISEALQTMGSQGKEIAPADCTLVLNWAIYEAILKDIAGMQSLAWAKADAIRTGFIGQLVGVWIVISGYLPKVATKYSAYLIHRNAMVLAPKRELLMESEKKPRDRKMEVTGSHTFGDAILDNKAAVEIKTAFT